MERSGLASVEVCFTRFAVLLSDLRRLGSRNLRVGRGHSRDTFCHRLCIAIGFSSECSVVGGIRILFSATVPAHRQLFNDCSGVDHPHLRSIVQGFIIFLFDCHIFLSRCKVPSASVCVARVAPIWHKAFLFAICFPCFLLRAALGSRCRRKCAVSTRLSCFLCCVALVVFVYHLRRSDGLRNWFLLRHCSSLMHHLMPLHVHHADCNRTRRS